jgi:hypothetical protein
LSVTNSNSSVLCDKEIKIKDHRRLNSKFETDTFEKNSDILLNTQKVAHVSSVIVEQQQEDMLMSSFGVTTSVKTNNFFKR